LARCVEGRAAARHWRDKCQSLGLETSILGAKEGAKAGKKASKKPQKHAQMLAAIHEWPKAQLGAAD